MTNYSELGMVVNKPGNTGAEVRNSTPQFTSAELVASTRQIGKWQIDGVRATGSTAVLMDAHAPDNSQVVIKVGTVSGPTAVEHGRNEARIAGRVAEATSHVPQVLEAGVETIVTRTTVNDKLLVVEGNYPVMVMEPVEGPTLREEVAKRGPLSPAETAKTLAPIADAVEAVHKGGFLHRDITPGNVKLDPRKGPTLLDFDNAVPEGTQADLVGTPGYLPPEEQRLGEPLTQESDTWQMGATAFSMMKGGEHVIPGDSIMQNTDYLADRGVYEEFLRKQVASFPISVQAALLHAMAYEPSARPTAKDFVRELGESAHEKQRSFMQRFTSHFSKSRVATA